MTKAQKKLSSYYDSMRALFSTELNGTSLSFCIKITPEITREVRQEHLISTSGLNLKSSKHPHFCIS